MGSGADTNGCGLRRPLSLKEFEFWGWKRWLFAPYPPPGSSHNSRNLISVSVLYFSDELSSLLLLSTKLRINGRGLMVWNIQVLEWPWLNTHRDTLYIAVELHYSMLYNTGQQSRHLLGGERERAIRGKREVSLEAETGRLESLIKFNSRGILIWGILQRSNGRRNKKINNVFSYNHSNISLF